MSQNETTDDLAATVARAMFDRRFKRAHFDASGAWPLWEGLYIEMAEEAIAVVRQWDAGK